MKFENEEWKHPEGKQGEVFIGNYNLSNFSLIKWKTKRLGKVPYNTQGNVMKAVDFFPVFVEKIKQQRLLTN